ncbi:hypothetical protein ACQP3L_35230, partial [Escherichia coli]
LFTAQTWQELTLNGMKKVVCNCRSVVMKFLQVILEQMESVCTLKENKKQNVMLLNIGRN